LPLFKYEAINEEGKAVNEKVEAASKKELIDKLKSKNVYIISVEEINEKNQRSLFSSSRVKSSDVTMFLRQLATLLVTGVPIIVSLKILKDQTTNKKFGEILSDIHETIHKGSSFSEALKKYPSVFSELVFNMVETGEVSGSIDMVIERLAVHYEKNEIINKKIKSALVYPIILSIVAFIVVTFMLVFVMPTFMTMFESSGVEIATPTKILIATGNGIRKYWYIIAIVVAALNFFLKKYFNTPEGRIRLDGMKLKIPVLKTVVINITTARFSRTMSTMIYSGVPLLDALENVSKVVGNEVVRRDLMDVKEKVKRGNVLSAPMAEIEYLPSMLSSMIKIGEESGDIDGILDKTATFYENEVETSLQQLVSLFEPLLIVVLGVVLGFIIISMALPMFDMVKTVG